MVSGEVISGVRKILFKLKDLTSDTHTISNYNQTAKNNYIFFLEILLYNIIVDTGAYLQATQSKHIITYYII